MNSEPQPQGLFAAISPEEAVRRVALARNAVVGEVQKVVVGHEDLIELALIALLAKGHCLLVGVPGAARSLTLSTLARVLHLRFSHVLNTTRCSNYNMRYVIFHFFYIYF